MASDSAPSLPLAEPKEVASAAAPVGNTGHSHGLSVNWGATMTDPREAILPLLPQLRAYARTLTGGNTHAADDLVQDTVMLALQSWKSFTPGTNLHAWLFRILHNRFHSVRGRKSFSAEVGVDDLEHRASVPAFQEGLADLRHFKVAFARLRPAHREALVLYAVHGLPYERIAEVTGCAVGSVKSRINRARTELKAMLLGDDAPKGAPDLARERREPCRTAAP
jgi:RNA polymerase sigma-70 factor (ECF subfamily)